HRVAARRRRQRQLRRADRRIADLSLHVGAARRSADEQRNRHRRDAKPDADRRLPARGDAIGGTGSMLTVNGLSCARGLRVLFRDLSFRADAGSFLQITGPNGSGKTTLLRTLAGLSRADAGTVEWNGAGEFAHARAYIGHAPGWKDT